MDKVTNEIYDILKALCAIPAPSHYEDERALWCKNYLLEAGFEKVYIDEAKNTICEYGCESSNEITVFAAHTDTVFPDTTPMPFYEKDGKAYNPGIGDDTASVAVLLYAAKKILKEGISSKNGVMFVLNSCEEGLGNLKGTRALFDTYKNRIKRFITFDSNYDTFVTSCVGSHRYEVEVTTAGGHSFNAFGNKNAIAALSEIVSDIYKIDLPKKENEKTTYNVGTIEGGTSVNTIAQSAKMLCEYRSSDVECLKIMKEKFLGIFEKHNTDDVNVKVTVVGERPCAEGVDQNELDKLIAECDELYKGILGVEIVKNSGSTDCNIPLSLGIPAIAVGSYYGEKTHTREEWIEIESLGKGYELALALIKKYL